VMELEKQAVDRVLEALAPAVQAELDRAIPDVRAQVSRELQSEFDHTLQQATDQLKAKLDDDLRTAAAEWAAERARLQEQIDQWRRLADAPRELARCTSQAEILARFLNLAEPFAASVAVYVLRADRLALWKARGEAAFPETQPGGDSDYYVKPVTIRAKTVAAVSAVAPHKQEVLDFLVECLERSIETFGMKFHTPLRPMSA
jgi:hypothetical protein